VHLLVKRNFDINKMYGTIKNINRVIFFKQTSVITHKMTRL